MEGRGTLERRVGLGGAVARFTLNGKKIRMAEQEDALGAKEGSDH